MVVGLNTEITPELEREGIAREFVNRVQNLRKEAGFDVQDRIIIYFDAPEKIANAIQAMNDYIAHETLAKSIINNIPEGAQATTVDLEIDQVRIYLEKL
jgi:isoleucyl-tRNA synthetase